MKFNPEIMRARREEKGYSQTILGKLIGISKTAIRKIELGLNIPRLPTLRVICEELDIKYNDLDEFEAINRTKIKILNKPANWRREIKLIKRKYDEL